MQSNPIYIARIAKDMQLEKLDEIRIIIVAFDVTSDV